MLTVPDLLALAGCGLALAAALIAYWRSRHQYAPHTAVGSGFTGSENVQQQGHHNTLHLHKSDYALVKELEFYKKQNCHLKKQNRELVKQKTALITFQCGLQERYYAQFERQQAENERLQQRVRELEKLERQIPFLPITART